MAELKECPFCGGKAETALVIEWDRTAQMRVGCASKRCPVKPRARADTTWQAARRWNKRKAKP